jgi:hypothetical protein
MLDVNVTSHIGIVILNRFLKVHDRLGDGLCIRGGSPRNGSEKGKHTISRISLEE